MQAFFSYFTVKADLPVCANGGLASKNVCDVTNNAESLTVFTP